jgi:hypothetical protein
LSWGLRWRIIVWARETGSMMWNDGIVVAL